MRRVLVIAAIILIIRPLLRWGFSFAAQTWWAHEPDPSPWTALRCGACRGIGDTHMCELARLDEYEEAA